MSQITKIFLRGLFALLPLSFSLYLLYWFFHQLEAFVDNLIFSPLPSLQSIPGLGVGVGLILIFLFGLFISSPLSHLYRLIEAPFRRVPFLKSVYSAIQDLVQYFNHDSKSKESVVVTISPPHFGGHFIGLLTRKNIDKLDPELFREDLVAVFIPMSYALGGYTVFVPAVWVRKIDMTVEQAMKSALTAWIQHKPHTTSTSN